MGRVQIQNDLGKLEKRSEINHMKCNKNKYKFLHLGWSNQMYKCRMEKNWLGWTTEV